MRLRRRDFVYVLPGMCVIGIFQLLSNVSFYNKNTLNVEKDADLQLVLADGLSYTGGVNGQQKPPWVSTAATPKLKEEDTLETLLGNETRVDSSSRENSTWDGDADHPDESGENGTFNDAFTALTLSPGFKRGLRKAHVLGAQRPNKTFLTVGVPTVKRDKAFYLKTTLDALIDAILPKDYSNIVIVVMVADLDPDYNSQVKVVMKRYFGTHLRSGLIQVIQTSSSIYPNLDPSRRNFNDSIMRTHWRCKQNIDTAFMFLYSRHLSTYYVNIEDDVIASRDFFTDIKRFIYSRKTPWVMLEFTRLGLIGKLFRSRDLEKLAMHLLTFYTEQPVDLLLPYAVHVMTQTKRVFAPYSLFQHIGVHSSLKNKKQTLTDAKFKRMNVRKIKKELKGNNPPAEIVTNFSAYGTTYPMDAYSVVSPYYFWASGVKKGQYYKITFTEPQNITKVIVVTGDVSAPKDIIEVGSLCVGSSERECSGDMAHLTRVAEFRQGRANTTLSKPLTVNCVAILLTAEQKNWIVFREVAVYTVQSPKPTSTVKPS